MSRDLDICLICGQEGELVICDTCNATFHRNCHPGGLTDEEMQSDAIWKCCRCLALEPLVVRYTVHGHLPGCFGRNTPNIIAPRCPIISDTGKKCAHVTSRQSCITKENGVYYGLCPAHWREFCVDKQWLSSISRCANTICDSIGMTLREREYLDESNLELRTKLPSHVYYDEEKPIITNHLNDEQNKAYRRRQRAEVARLDRMRINLRHAQDDMEIFTRLARARNYLESESASLDSESELLSFISISSDDED